MKKVLLLVIILGLLILGGFSGWGYAKSTPQYSVYKLFRAVKEHDYETFSRYFDADSVIDDAIAKITQDSSTSNDLSTEELGLAQGFLSLLTPALKGQIKSSLRREIENGSFWKDAQPPTVTSAFTDVKVQKKGKVAQVTIINDKGESLKFQMRDKGRYWQVFAIDLDDAKELFEGTGVTEDSSSQTLTVKFGERASIGEGWFLTVSEPTLYQPSADSFLTPKDGYKFIAIEVVYENTSNTTDYFSLSNLKLKDTEDRAYSEYGFGGREPQLESSGLEAGGRVKGFVTFEIPQDTREKSVVYTGSQATVIFSR